MGTAGREKTCVVTNLDYMKTSKQAAPRCLPNIAKFLIMGTFVENFEKSVDVGEKNFCFLELSTSVNIDYSRPQRTGQSHPRLFMMSRATDDYDLSKHIANPKLSQELNAIGRTFGFIEDMEDALKSGGNGLAKYLAKMYPGRHVALPPISKDSKVLYIKCEWLTPKELLTPGILQRELCRGRPLKTFHETTEEKATSTASLERLSRVDAETGGWVMQW
eukprot:g1477.t1